MIGAWKGGLVMERGWEMVASLGRGIVKLNNQTTAHLLSCFHTKQQAWKIGGNRRAPAYVYRTNLLQTVKHSRLDNLYSAQHTARKFCTMIPRVSFIKSSVSSIPLLSRYVRFQLALLHAIFAVAMHWTAGDGEGRAGDGEGRAGEGEGEGDVRAGERSGRGRTTMIDVHWELYCPCIHQPTHPASRHSAAICRICIGGTSYTANRSSSILQEYSSGH